MNMKTELAALLTGLAVLGSAAAAQADAVPPAVGAAATQVVMLTDSEMANVTAGHLSLDKPGKYDWHHGPYWYWNRHDSTWEERNGSHRDQWNVRYRH